MSADTTPPGLFARLYDDLDGSAIADGEAHTIEFSLDGASYEITLSDSNAAMLLSAFAPFVEAARWATPSTDQLPKLLRNGLAVSTD